MKSNKLEECIMKEKLQRYWLEHKEEIKTGTILVIIPIAVLGLISSKGLNDIAHFLSIAADQAKDGK
jgi:hypothetical protein